MNSKIFTTFVLSAALFVAANAKADIVTIYGNQYGANNYDAYMEMAGPSNWALTKSDPFHAGKPPISGHFTLENTVNAWAGPDNQIPDQQGTWTLTNWNGGGAGYDGVFNTVGEVGMGFSHNSGNTGIIEMPSGLISAFYLHAGSHSSGTQGTYNITFYGEGGDKLQTFNNVAFGFAGFIFEEGYTFSKFELTINGTNNSGFYFDFIPGDGTPAVPEPATLAIIGLGLAGLGLARARRMRK